LDRFYIKSKADIIVLCDADLLIAGNFDDVLIRSYKENVQLGFIAHVSPFNGQALNEHDGYGWWSKIFAEAKLPLPEFNQTHTGWGILGSTEDISRKMTPFYFNYGFIVSPRKYIEQMGKTYEQDICHVENVIDTWFKSQIANTLSYTRHNIPCATISLNYNYPLHISEEAFRKLNVAENGQNQPKDIKIFHYLGDGEFNKTDFISQESLNLALKRPPLSKSGEEFKKILGDVYKTINNTSVISKNDISAPPTYILCGIRRTGTTLLNAIFSSSSACNKLGQEAQFLTRILESYQWSENNYDDFGRSFFSEKNSLKEFYHVAITDLLHRISNFTTASTLILKNPELSFVLNEINDTIPHAHIFATIRDPRDQIASELEVGARRVSMGIIDNNYTQRNIDAYIQSYLKYITPLLSFKNIMPSKIHFLKYEDLILNTKSIISDLEIITGLEIPFSIDSRWENVSEHAALHIGPSSSKHYDSPISSESVGRYTKDLTIDESNKIEIKMRDIMNLFNYQ